MPVEQRVVSGQKIGGGKPGGSIGARETPEPAPEPPVKKRSKKLLLVVAAAVVLAAAAAWFFLLRGGDAGAAEPVHEPGEVLAIEPISLNLAEGHYLRFGMTLQLTAHAGGGGHGTVDGSKAVDIAIDLYSGRPLAEVSGTEGRVALKAELLHRLEEAYHGEVMDVYLTNYVTQ